MTEKEKAIYDEFYDICLDEKLETYFVLDDDFNPLALGGAYEVFEKKEKCAKLWLLATNKISQNKLTLYKYVKNKIDNLEIQKRINKITRSLV